MKTIRSHARFSTLRIDPKGLEDRLKRLNDEQKRLTRGKGSYVERMSPARVEKIGAQTLLDKHWAEKPLGVIKNPHKLTEVELYRTLEKIVELPEKRLKSMLKMGNNAVDEVFLANVIQRVPQFLTATLVNLTRALTL